jgi:hypothetical protein
MNIKASYFFKGLMNQLGSRAFTCSQWSYPEIWKFIVKDLNQ